MGWDGTDKRGRRAGRSLSNEIPLPSQATPKITNHRQSFNFITTHYPPIRIMATLIVLPCQWNQSFQMEVKIISGDIKQKVMARIFFFLC